MTDACTIHTIDWKEDNITDRFRIINADRIKDIKHASNVFLVEAIKYCKSIQNPFTMEMIEREGKTEEYNLAVDSDEKMRILNNVISSYRPHV